MFFSKTEYLTIHFPSPEELGVELLTYQPQRCAEFEYALTFGPTSRNQGL